jgi:rRNA-processing protein FCF1
VCYGAAYVRAVLDSSTLLSLAWAGQLDLLGVCPLELLVPGVVLEETASSAMAQGHADGAAIAAAVHALAAPPGDLRHEHADHAVLAAAHTVGTLLTNDLALGRRAANLGVRWLRTADLVILTTRVNRIDRVRARGAIDALHSAGRLTAALHEAYTRELE